MLFKGPDRGFQKTYLGSRGVLKKRIIFPRRTSLQAALEARDQNGFASPDLQLPSAELYGKVSNGEVVQVEGKAEPAQAKTAISGAGRGLGRGRRR